MLRRSDFIAATYALSFVFANLRNRNRGKNADDDDYDQKLNKGNPLFIA